MREEYLWSVLHYVYYIIYFTLGGLVIIVMREEYLWSVPEYKDQLEFMKKLETDGKWIQLEKTIIPEHFYQYNGVRFVFRITK